jgi:hypothetical protein
MAYAVTAWKAYARPIDQSITRRFEHVIEAQITGLAADVDLDFGDLAGAFWTSAEAHATYGATATALKNYIASLYPRVSSRRWECDALESTYVRVAGAPGLASEYQVIQNATTALPEFVFLAASAPTAYTLVIEAKLKTGEWPLIDTKYGTNI